MENLAQQFAGRINEFRDADTGEFWKSSAQVEVEKIGAREFWNSNEGQYVMSFAPTRRYQFPDGSWLEINYSGMHEYAPMSYL